MERGVITTLTASGAGTPGVDGDYAENGTVNSKAKYDDGGFQVRWNGSTWVVCDIAAPGDVYYTNGGGGSTPPLTGWATGIEGTAPAPTFTMSSDHQHGELWVSD